MNTSISDDQLIQKILKGEKHLFEFFVRRFNQQLFRISMSIVNDEQEAEDIMQIAYLNAYQNLSGFNNQSSFSTWLTRILINESILHKKRKLNLKIKVTESEYKHIDTKTPLDNLMNKELKIILEKAVAALPEKYRIVFVMREVHGMSTNETMDALDIGESNVKIRLTRAKEMLRTELSSYWQPGQLYEFNLVRCDVIVKHVMTQINLLSSSAQG